MLRVLNMVSTSFRHKEGRDLDIKSIRESIQEVLSYLSLVISRSTKNPFILARMESEIGLRLEAVMAILLKIDGLLKKMDEEDLTDREGYLQDVLLWIPVLKRFYIVLENLPVVAGPYGDLVIFNLSIRAKGKLEDIVSFLEDLIKKTDKCS